MLNRNLSRPFIISRRKTAYTWLPSDEPNQYLFVDQVFRPGDRLRIIRHPGYVGSRRRWLGREIAENISLLGEIVSAKLERTYIKTGKKHIAGPLKNVLAVFDFPAFLRHVDRITESQTKERARLTSDRDSFEEAHRAMLHWKQLTEAAREAESLELALKTEHLRLARTPNRRELNRIGKERMEFKDSLGRFNALISGCQFLIALRLAEEQIAIDLNSAARNERRKDFTVEFAAEVSGKVSNLFELLHGRDLIAKGNEDEIEEVLDYFSFKPFCFAASFARLTTPPVTRERREMIGRAFTSELLLAELSDFCSSFRHGGSIEALRAGLLPDIARVLRFHPAYEVMAERIMSSFRHLFSTGGTSKSVDGLEQMIRYRHDSPFSRLFISSEFHHMLPEQGVLAV